MRPSHRAIVAGFFFWLLPFAAALAEEGEIGHLDFSRLTKPQEQFFWRRLKSLAVDEAVLAYCGQPDDFEAQAKQGVRSCVTSEALGKAEAFFRSELTAAQKGLRERAASCTTKPKANRGWLGVELKSAENEAANGAGAIVTGAMENSPATAAGLKAGDAITAVNGGAIAGAKELSAKIRSLAPGAVVQLGVLRGGAGQTVSVTLGAMAFDSQGRAALDMPALIALSKQDLASVANEVTEMCGKCKTSIWAIFCR